MAGSLILVLMAGLIRLASGMAWSWLALLRDRSRRRSLEALARCGRWRDDDGSIRIRRGARDLDTRGWQRPHVTKGIR